MIARDNPRRVLYLGDVYEHGTATDFRKRFETVYGPLAARMDPTPGNHDWPNHATGYDPYWRKIKGRASPTATRSASPAGGSSASTARRRTTPPSCASLRRQVKGRRCVLAFMHRPRFNAGMHHNEERDVEKLWQALRGRARLLLSGHDHNLQRFKRVDGTTQLVIGAGGRERYAVNGADPGSRTRTTGSTARCGCSCSPESRACASSGPTAASWTARRSVAGYGCSTILIAPSCFFWNVS